MRCSCSGKGRGGGGRGGGGRGGGGRGGGGRAVRAQSAGAAGTGPRVLLALCMSGTNNCQSLHTGKSKNKASCKKVQVTA
jgi:hypothetical protein